MFDPGYKQPLPRFIRTLGVVTAPTGAAVRDIIQISRRRNPGIRILLYPAKVQGEGAAESIVRGIRALDAAGVDVMIIGRGGGSIEDLWAFNEEITARAVFSCRVPVISAVGHETDTVITECVADMRAPTPSAAAELAVADIRQVLMQIGQTQQQLRGLMEQKITDSRSRVETLGMKLALQSPREKRRQLAERKANLETELHRLMREKVRNEKERMALLAGNLTYAANMAVRDSRHRVSLLTERMAGLSPFEKLSSGYAWITGPEGRRILSASELREGDLFTARFLDGSVQARAEQILPVEKKRG